MTPTVLFVDDEERVLSAVKRVLRKESYKILTARSAREGMALLKQHDIDVVVSDEMMPETSGTEFLAQVRETYPNTIRIMLTGNATLVTAIRALNMGEIYRFLTKPCDPMELALSVRQALAVKRLTRESARLLNKTRQQSEALKTLEASHPGVSSVQRANDGAYVLDDVGTESIESLAEEIRTELDVAV